MIRRCRLTTLMKDRIPVRQRRGPCGASSTRRSALTRIENLISDKGTEIYSYMQQQGISQVAIMGVHTNMCILNRSFAIKQMLRWGMDTVLVRDLTDAMYNPAMPPYVSHDEGTQLVIAYIEKHWCPTILSNDLSRRSEE